MIYVPDGADVDVGFGSLVGGHELSLKEKDLKSKKQLPKAMN